MQGHGGHFAAEALLRYGVDIVFTLSGGHLFPLYDGCVARGIRLVDTRHEQTAAFAAEGWAKVTRRPGVAALTAGPGVTNGVSALANAYLEGSPVVVIGGRAPQARWGAGSLQEMDHVPVVAPVTKRAVTAGGTVEIGFEMAASLAAALTPPRGPCFLDLPLDVIFGQGDGEVPDSEATPVAPGPDPGAVRAVGKLLAESARPVIVAGSGVYWDAAESVLLEVAEALRLPVVMWGAARGALPAGHELAFPGEVALPEADLVVAVGVPSSYLGPLSSRVRVVHLAEDADLAAGLRTLGAEVEGAAAYVEWLAGLAAGEVTRRKAAGEALRSDRVPIEPARVYGELRARLSPDALVVFDGHAVGAWGDQYLEAATPGCFLDSGPHGHQGAGPGYGLAARLAHPDRQVVLVLSDEAAGFSLMDFDTLARHAAPVVALVLNDRIDDPPTRYDQVVAALGGHGEMVADPTEVGPAIDRAFSAGVPALVNVSCRPFPGTVPGRRSPG